MHLNTEQTNRGWMVPRELRAVVAIAFFLVAQSAQAAIIHLSGTTVDFYYDDAQPGIAAFGSITAVGDSVFAQPTSFFAEAANAGGSDSFSALGTVTVVAKAGYSFDLVQVGQQGDYTLSGTGAAVSVSADLDVTDSTNAATTVTAPLVSTSDFTLQGTNSWDSLASVDLGTAFWNGVTSIDLTLDVLLNASTTSNGESARIDNKFTGGGLVTVMTSPVPVPAAIWLFGGGLGLLAGFARRRAC